MADKENNNALDEAQIKQILTNIPNNVSGDGKVFVAALKNYLVKSGLLTNKKIDDNTSSAGEKPGHVSSVQLLELHSITDGVRINSIQVSWVKTTVTNYAKAEVWFRTATDKAWEKAGESSGTQFVYSGATTGLTYYIKVVAVNTKGNAADFDTAPQASIKIQGSQYIPNPPTQFVLTWDEKGPLWKWQFEPNEYIDFFELRLDQNPGVWNDKRLDSTRETWSRANPGVRSGTAYLYIRNIFGEYSEPAVHEFNKALPQKPTAPQLTSTIDGVRIKMQGLPLGATGYKIHIKTKDSQETVEDDFYTVNSEYIYFFFIGHITVKYCFVDPLGDGEWSDTSEADCKAGIDIGQVPTIDYTKFDKFTQDAINKANNQPSINEDLKKLIDANTNGIHQNEDSITSVVKRVDTAEGTLKTQGTAIQQNANSITSVVTELNKKPADCNYSSINQLQDDILLCVKKDGIINAINVSTEGIVIDGKKVHITGDTVFDNNVIVGGMIAADSIALEHLRANSVSSAKIQANAITSTKIGAGAVTADKIEAGAITAEKLAADSVTSDAIQAGSVIGDKIAANTITGKHFAAANIDLTGALTITGGNVKLSQEGLRLSSNDGSFTLFNQEGINYIDAHGITYAQVKKMIIGKAYDGQYIRFAAPWPTPPSVLMSPMTIKINDESYPAATFCLVCEATDITENGFKVNNYLRLDEGSYGVNNDERTDNTSIYNVLKMEQYWYGHYSYSYDFKVSSDVMDVTFPETANYIELSLVLDIKNPLAHHEHGNSGGYVNGSVNIDYPNANRGYTSYDNSKRTITAQLYIGETKLSEATFTVTSSLPSEKKNFVLSGRFEAGQTRAFVRIIWNMKLNTGEHGSWETLYNGRNDIARACCAASVTKAYHKYSAATSKIARGYAMFLVTDGSTNTYTVEVTVQVLINYDGKPLAATTITVDGVEYTTDLNGIIEMSGNGSKEHTFAYGTAPTTKAVVNYTDGVVTTIEIQPASITCYLRILYDGKSVANDTVTVNGETKTTDADGKIEIGGVDKHTGDYVVAYGNDSTKITVTYVANGVTNVALYSIVEGSKVFTTEDNGTETFTVPAGITKLLLTATVDNADFPPGEEVQYSCSVTNTANNTVWGYGEAYSFIEDDGETEHTDMRSVVEVTPRKEYTLKFVGATIFDTVDGIKFEWSKTINAMTANIVDK